MGDGGAVETEIDIDGRNVNYGSMEDGNEEDSVCVDHSGISNENFNENGNVFSRNDCATRSDNGSERVFCSTNGSGQNHTDRRPIKSCTNENINTDEQSSRKNSHNGCIGSHNKHNNEYDMDNGDGRVRKRNSHNQNSSASDDDQIFNDDDSQIDHHDDQVSESGSNRANRADGEVYVSRLSRSRSRSRHDSPRVVTLYVTNLPHRCTPSDLKKLFEEIGPVSDCRIVTNPVTKDCRGFGFVKFDSAEDSTKAIEKFSDNVRMLGHSKPIHVERARRNDPHDPTPGHYRGPPGASVKYDRSGKLRPGFLPYYAVAPSSTRDSYGSYADNGPGNGGNRWNGGSGGNTNRGSGGDYNSRHNINRREYENHDSRHSSKYNASASNYVNSRENNNQSPYDRRDARHNDDDNYKYDVNRSHRNDFDRRDNNNDFDRDRNEREKDRDRFERGRNERERNDREYNERERSDRERNDRDRHERDRYDRERNDRDHNERERSDRDRYFDKRNFAGAGGETNRVGTSSGVISNNSRGREFDHHDRNRYNDAERNDDFDASRNRNERTNDRYTSNNSSGVYLNRPRYNNENDRVMEPENDKNRYRNNEDQDLDRNFQSKEKTRPQGNREERNFNRERMGVSDRGVAHDFEPGMRPRDRQGEKDGNQRQRNDRAGDECLRDTCTKRDENVPSDSDNSMSFRRSNHNNFNIEERKSPLREDGRTPNRHHPRDARRERRKTPSPGRYRGHR